MMRSSAFEGWAARYGGLNLDSARSYVSYLATVEKDYSVDLDADWQLSKLLTTRSRLTNDQNVNPNSQRNRLSALSKYEAFCLATSE